MKASTVFTPGAFPQHTYVSRGEHSNEQTLRDALDTPGQIVSLVGPSKSGKTVLVEKVVGQDFLITVTGAGIRSPDDIWNRALDWMDVPDAVVEAKTNTQGIEAGVEIGAEGGLPGLAKAQAHGNTTGSIENQQTTSTTVNRRGLERVVRDIADSDFVLLVDDFHYMPRDVQSEAAKQLKEAVRKGVKVCTAAVVHRGDDLIRSNPELRGRVRAVDLTYWNMTDLRSIAVTGFKLLGVRVDDAVLNSLVAEAAGSPQLMQLLCLNLCFVANVRETQQTHKTLARTDIDLSRVYEQASAATDFRSLVDVLDAGPRTRGRERRIYDFSDSTNGDVYRCVLKAISADPPRLSFAYDELLRRCAKVVVDDPPVGSSVTSTCLHMSKLALEKFPKERAIDWDESKDILDLPDPYLLFYLRWSQRLREAD